MSFFRLTHHLPKSLTDELARMGQHPRLTPELLAQITQPILMIQVSYSTLGNLPNALLIDDL